MAISVPLKLPTERFFDPEIGWKLNLLTKENTMTNYLNSPSPENQQTVLTTEQVAVVRAIEAYDLWFVVERLTDKKILRPQQLDTAIKEFKKFMALIALGHRDISMTSPEVDEVWHNFILFTYEYANFCSDFIGEFVHHVPRTSRRQISSLGRERFVSAYENVFGSMPQMWSAGDTLREKRSSYARDCDSSCGNITDSAILMDRADCEGVGDETALPPDSFCSGDSKSEKSPPREKEQPEPNPAGHQTSVQQRPGVLAALH